MIDSIRASKRVLAIVTAIAAIAWSVGLATLVAPLAASAAVIPSGSLVKGSLPAVYYVGADGKRYVFTNEKVYKTWYSDFSTVMSISDADLASLMIGGNVTYRPGVKMIKIQSDPKTYAISKDGTLRWVKTEAVAVALYGSTWNQQIDDVSDAFFVNYKMGADINSASDYNKAQELANATSINADKGLGTTPIAGSVTVSVASSSPSSMSIPSGAFYAPLLTLAVKNNTSAAVNLTGLTINRTGIISDSAVAGVLVTDGMGLLHGTLVTFGQSVAMPGFASDPIRIMPNATENVTISVNIGSVTSGTIGASVLAATGVMVTDANAASVAVGGSFPISGSMMSVVDGTGSIGSVKISTQAIIGGTESSPIEIDQGATNLDVAKFRLQEGSGNEDIELMNLELQNNGSASASDFSNIRLIDQDNQVIATVAGVMNNIAKFSVLSMTGSKAGPHGGYKIPAGQQRDFTVRIDTSANTNSASRTINFTVQNNFRVRAVGLETGVGVTPSVDSPTTFPVGDTEGGANWVKFRTGTLTISRATESLSGKLPKGATNVALATFDVRAFGEPIEIQEIEYVVLDQNGSVLVAGDKSLVGTVKINNQNGATIYSRTATDGANYGGTCTVSSNTIAGTCGGAAGSSLQTLSSFYTVQANSTGKLVFVSDIDQNASSTDGYTVRLESIKFRKSSSNTFATTTANIDGNGLTVEASTLTVTKSSSYNPVNLVKGGTLQKLGSFDLQSGAAEGQRVNAMKVQICTNNGTITSVATHCDAANTTSTGIQAVTNITLKSGETQLAPAQSITTASGGTFSTQFEVPANTTKTVDIYAVVSSAYGFTNLGSTLTATSFTGLSSQTTNSGSAVLGQDLLISSGGTLSFTDLGNDGVVNVAKLLHASEMDVALFKFKVRETTNAEAMTLGKVYLAVDKGALNTFSSYKLFNEATGQQVGSANNAIITIGSAGEVRFGGLNLALAKGGEINLIVKGSSVDASTVAASNMDARMGVSFVEYTGSVSGTTTRESGGMITGQVASDVTGTGTFVAAADFIVVNDVADFEIGDLVQVDANNTATYDAAAAFAVLTTDVANTSGINETVPQYIKSVGTFTITLAQQSLANCTSATPAVCTLVNGGVAHLIDNSANALYTNNDLVRLDANNDGDLLDTVNGFNETVTYFAVNVAAVNPGTLQLSLTSGGTGIASTGTLTAARFYNVSKNHDITGTALAAGGRVVKYSFSSQNHEVQEIEPTITGLNVGAGNQVSENEVGVFVIRNDGNRSLVVAQLRFEVSGSYNAASGTNPSFGPHTFKLDRADPTTGARIANTLNSGSSLATYTLAAGSPVACVTAGGVADADCSPATTIPLSGAVLQFDLVTAGINEEIGAGSSKGYVVLANTTAVKNNALSGTTATTQLRMLGSKANPVAGTTDGLVWSYTRTSNGASSGNLTISDSYIVSGKSLLYQ